MKFSPNHLRILLKITSLVSVVSFLSFSSIPLQDNGLVLGTKDVLVSENLISTRPKISIEITNLVPKPIFLNTSTPPIITATSAYVMDRTSHTPLYQKNEHSRKYPASTTKITTAVVALEETDLNEIVIVPSDVFEKSGGSNMGLSPGELIIRKNLLWGMLVNSGNDAAYTLAATFPEGFTTFVEKMNELTNQLNLKNTFFTNSIGFDTPNHYTSAYDLAILTDYTLNFPLFRQIVGTRKKIVSSQNPEPNIYKLKNTNPLLGKITGVTGVKTGWTNLARGILVTSVNRNNHEIILVVMQSEERVTDTIELTNWVYNNYEW